MKGAQGKGNEKVGTKPDLVPVLVPSFPLFIARYPLHLPHTVVASDSITNSKHCITHIRVLIMSHCFTLCLTNSLLSSQTIHLEFSTRRK